MANGQRWVMFMGLAMGLRASIWLTSGTGIFDMSRLFRPSQQKTQCTMFIWEGSMPWPGCYYLGS